MQCLEPALSGARAQHLPYGNIVAEALEGDSAESAILEQPAGQPPCARCNHHSARFSQRLEASGKIGRLPDDHLLLSGTRADEVAYNNEAGCDSDPHLRRRASIRREFWDGLG
jgi:hypothetical protein